MKTKEEIEQLAEAQCHTMESRFGFAWGYEQCQEDMADKKYTDEDIRKAIQVGVSAEAGDYPEGFTYKLGITLEDYYINLLNKQD